ncbi:hypothetical protein TUM4261_27580 [Shewanella sp. c952]|nr:hypothetical protein TUM4261_27580 [Shewanella sp. c952]
MIYEFFYNEQITLKCSFFHTVHLILKLGNRLTARNVNNIELKTNNDKLQQLKGMMVCFTSKTVALAGNS